jgi:hypothetical protein
MSANPLFQAVITADKMREYRDTVRAFYGDKYDAITAEARLMVEDVMARTGKPALEATRELCKGRLKSGLLCDSTATLIFIATAYDMIAEGEKVPA